MADKIVQTYWWVVYQFQKGIDWLYSHLFHSIDIDLSDDDEEELDD